MGKASRAKGAGARAKKQQENSSDDDLYDKNGQFDPSNPFGDDEIESFHEAKDKRMVQSLQKKKSASSKYDIVSDEEVLAFDDDDSDDDEEDVDSDDAKYDIEDSEDGEDEKIKDGDELEVDENGLSYWGAKKSSYYSGNRIQNDEDAQLEEEEAANLQAKMMRQLDSSDFGLDAFKLSGVRMKTRDELETSKLVASALADENETDNNTTKTTTSTSPTDNLEEIATNLSGMSRAEKLEFLQQESPELFELVRDFKEKCVELEEFLLPVFGAIKRGQVARSSGTDYVINKTKLYLMYSSHLSFYFALKSSRTPVDNHPIVKNLLQYRNICKQIRPIDENLFADLAYVRDCVKNNTPLRFLKSSELVDSIRVKKSAKFRDSTTSRAKLAYDVDEEDDDEEVEDKKEEAVEGDREKRAIDYTISKNKGLTPKRNKMYRNPRVKNRIKSRKAIIKRKSIVPGARSQDQRYTGESTGIRTHIARSTKIA